MRGLLALVLVACAHGVVDPAPTEDASPPSPMHSAAVESPVDPPPCSLRDRIVTDGGFVFDVPLPCAPLPSRDLGDPQP